VSPRSGDGERRPRVTLKVAASLDGSIATAQGESQWITGPQAREDGHRLRASHDVILVGVGTVLADDPQLTCRLSEEGSRHPVPVVLDTTLRSPETSKVFAGPRRAIVYTGPGAQRVDFPADVVEVPRLESGRLCMRSVLQDLSLRGHDSVLVEGGAEVSRSIMDGDWVDVLQLYLAPKLIPGGASWLAGEPLEQLSDAHHLEVLEVCRVGADVRLTLGRQDRT